MKRESGSGGALLLLACGGAGPRKEFVEAIVGPEIDQAGEDISEPSLGINAGQFGCFDERGEDGPIFGAVIVAGEESILACQSLWAHRALDDVGVELDAAIIEEAGQAVPVPQPVANGLGRIGAAREVARAVARRRF